MPHRRRLLDAGVPLAAGIWLLGRVRAPRAQTDDPTALSPLALPAPHRVSVIIPARDEERSLPTLLASIAVQTRRPDEVIVVDDHSTDRTAERARSAGAVVVAAPPLPPGWVGKTWACHHGAAAATGGLLLFLDADVELAPDALARLIGEHDRVGGLVSVQPSHRSVELHEQLSAVCNVVTMMGTGAFTGPPRRPAAMAFGPCLLIGRHDYDAVGGHAEATVRLQVAEDIALARRVRSIGRPVTLFAGGDIVGFRMYPDGVGQLVAGWTKMIGNGGRLTPWPLRLAVGIWVAGALLGARRGTSVVGACIRGRPGASTAVDAAVYGAWVVEMAWLMGRVGRWRRITAVAFPVPVGAFVGLFVRSALLVARRQPATWRGRDVPAS